MKPKFRDYLTILVALLAIFLCGYGVGFLTGEKKGLEQGPRGALFRDSNESGDWKNRTMERLSQSLNLTDAQKEKVGSVVKSTSEKIKASRDETVKNYYLHLLELHDQLLPHLDSDQQEKIKKDRKSLQQAIDLRFQSSSTK